MNIFSLPTGRIEIELYRLKFLAKEHLKKFLAKHANLAGLATVSMLVVLMPTVSTPANAYGFPETGQHIAFTQSSTPLAGIEQAAEIVPGESYVEQAEREKRERAGPRAVKQTPRGQSTPKRTILANETSCPDSFRPFYQEVAPQFGVPWQVLEAIHQVESGKSCHTGRRSGAGATGPMQFLPSTWKHYAWDCTGDGEADITDAYDSICTGAHYIGTGLTGTSLERSIYSYNHSWSYVSKVMRIANEIGLDEEATE